MPSMLIVIPLSAFAPARLSGKRPMVRGMLCPASRGKGKWTTAEC